MNHVSSFREPRRRSRQCFRSQELLNSITVSAEAITLRADSGNPEEAAARAASRRSSRAQSFKAEKHQAPAPADAVEVVAAVTNAKIMTLKKLKSMRKYHLGVHGPLREDEEEEEKERVKIGGFPIKARRKSMMPIDPAILPRINLTSPTRKSAVGTSHEKHAIGKFETRDSKWKATIDGEVEKFMYPSLRLETLYSQEESSPDEAGDTTDEIDEKPMPSPRTIEEALTSTSKVSWELEHVAPSPATPIPVQEVDSKRLRFDQKLQDAEVILSTLARNHPKRTDCSQYGHGFYWRNAFFNQKSIQLTYSFFDHLPHEGILEFDYVSPLRPEDKYIEDHSLDFPEGSDLDQTLIQSTQTAMTDQELASLLAQVGAEVCAIYVSVHKRQNLKYHLVLFHLAIAGRRILTRQAHHVLQHFPKNYESGRLRALVAMHHAIVDLEYFGELLERLALTDRPRVYMVLGYLSTIMPLDVDMDFEVDFTRDDEKMLLRALVDLSISCPMDMIRIDSTRSTVLIIYSMYQTNTIPATGRICFRYVTHQAANRQEWLRARQQIYRHFLCGDRLKSLSDSAAFALAASAGNNDSSSNATAGGAANSSNVTESGNPATSPA
ncbi:Leucine-rich repeat-containing protein [Phytophthora cinnamomi]|uniref:Leucine-rich repeat-containing protein n=1 Tax=Phytophthora cinnamomi TaxID=4785 RepID=UPI00355AB803|nr:Leucine-rich repeat-containing protein [Phytophthora cinnamomi]